jgi:hypothetical protein
MAENMTKEYDLTKTPFSWDKLDGLLQYKSSLTVCSELMGCPASTIQNHIKERFGLTFTDYAEMKLSPMKFKLVQKAIQMALAGDRVMMIFSLKNICKWSDNNENTIDISKIQINVEKQDESL